MKEYSLSHVPDSVLLRDLAALIVQDRATTADLLAHIGEVDARRLYAELGYSSMFAYCVGELHLSEDATARRIQAARAARRFPALFVALAEGRLHLTAISLLAAHITPENVNELIEAATHLKKSEIEELVAARFSFQPPPRVRLLTPIPSPQHAPAHVATAPGTLDAFEQHAEHVAADPSEQEDLNEHALAHVEPQVVPSPKRFLLQLMIEEGTRDKLQHALALLSHAVPDGNAARVIDRALDSLIKELETRKFGSAKRRVRDGAIAGGR